MKSALGAGAVMAEPTTTPFRLMPRAESSATTCSWTTPTRAFDQPATTPLLLTAVA